MLQGLVYYFLPPEVPQNPQKYYLLHLLRALVFIQLGAKVLHAIVKVSCPMEKLEVIIVVYHFIVQMTVMVPEVVEGVQSQTLEYIVTQPWVDYILERLCRLLQLVVEKVRPIRQDHSVHL